MQVESEGTKKYVFLILLLCSRQQTNYHGFGSTNFTCWDLVQKGHKSRIHGSSSALFLSLFFLQEHTVSNAGPNE